MKLYGYTSGLALIVSGDTTDAISEWQQPTYWQALDSVYQRSHEWAHPVGVKQSALWSSCPALDKPEGVKDVTCESATCMAVCEDGKVAMGRRRIKCRWKRKKGFFWKRELTECKGCNHLDSAIDSSSSYIDDWFRLPGWTGHVWHTEPEVYFKCQLNKKNVRICVASCRTPVIPAAIKVEEVTTQPTVTTTQFDPWAGFSCDRSSCPDFTTPVQTTIPTSTPPAWSCDRDSRFTCISSTTPIVSTTTDTITGPTLVPITVVEYPHLIYDIETKASDYVILGRKKFRIRCKCPRSDPDRACNWYQSDIKFTEDFLNNLNCDPPGELPTMEATTAMYSQFEEMCAIMGCPYCSNCPDYDNTILLHHTPDVTTTPVSDSTSARKK